MSILNIQMRYTSRVIFYEAPNLHHHGFLMHDEFETSQHMLKASSFIHNIQLTQTHAVQSQSFPNVYRPLAVYAPINACHNVRSAENGISLSTDTAFSKWPVRQ